MKREGAAACLLAHPVTDPPSPSPSSECESKQNSLNRFAAVREREEEDSLARATDVCTQTGPEERRERDIATTCKWKD